MKSMTISTRIDEPTKIAFSQVCEEVGLSPSQAIQLFAKAVVNYGGIPFEIKAPKPNATSIKAMQAFDNSVVDDSDANQTLESAEDFPQFLKNLEIDLQTLETQDSKSFDNPTKAEVTKKSNA